MRGKETIKRFEKGELIPSRALHAASEDYFFRRVIPLVLKEKVTRQKSLGLPQYPADIYYQLVAPVVGKDIDVPTTLESDHLCRPVNLHTGKTTTIKLAELAIDYYKGKFLEAGQSSYLSRSEMERLEEARVSLRQEMRKK